MLGLASLMGVSCNGGSDKPASASPGQTKSSAKLDAPKVILYETVTIFGIALTSEPEALDPKLARFENDLRRQYPGNGFKLRAVQSKRLGPDETLTCDMGSGVVASTELVGVERNGKVQLKFSLTVNGRTELKSVITTPTNQLFFCEKKLANGDRLLIGIGAR
jgi:hypothetical protein